MKKLTSSTLHTLLIAASVLSGSVHATSTGGSPKLSDDPPPGRISAPPTSSATSKVANATSPISAARVSAPKTTLSAIDRRHYSNHCTLSDATSDTSLAPVFRVPMATRWWWVNKEDVRFCVIAGAIKADGVNSKSYALQVVHEGSGAIDMVGNSGDTSLAVGGSFDTNSQRWPTAWAGARMATSELCTPRAVKRTDLSALPPKLKLYLTAPNSEGSCAIRFAEAPWVELRPTVRPQVVPQVMPQNVPVPK